MKKQDRNLGGWKRWSLPLVVLLAATTMNAQPAGAQSRTPVSHRVLATGSDGVWASPRTLLASSAEDWDLQMRDLYLEGALLGSDLPPAPSVDWSRSVVILVTMGYVPDNTQRLSINAAETSESMVHLGVTVLHEQSVGRHCRAYAIVELDAVGRGGVEVDYQYAEAEVAASGSDVSRSWGSLKASYR